MFIAATAGDIQMNILRLQNNIFGYCFSFIIFWGPVLVSDFDTPGHTPYPHQIVLHLLGRSYADDLSMAYKHIRHCQEVHYWKHNTRPYREYPGDPKSRSTQLQRHPQIPDLPPRKCFRFFP